MNLYNLEKILSLTQEPDLQEDFNKWIRQKEVVGFLEQEIEDEDIIIYATLPHLFIHAVLIPERQLNKSNIKDLIRWDCDPFSTWGVVCSSDNVWVEEPLANSGSKIINQGEQIIFCRSFEGNKPTKNYIEIEQKISHILGIHYVSERNSWCRLDQFGDIEEIIKIIEVSDLPYDESGKIITAKKDILGKYTSIRQFVLCRTFDFTRYKTNGFSGWGNKDKPVEFGNKKTIFGNLVIYEGYGSYSRGVQIKNISVPKEQIIKTMWEGPSHKDRKQYASFIAQDWKNKWIAEISCNPSCLANYFTKSELPFEITPAFFRPEVLLKYKSDREKYELNSRSVSCRGAWHLETFDINDAGQVHTYLIYLSRLPYKEQLHWKQYNEKPKTPIAKRAFTTDFEGQFYDEYDPLNGLKHKLEELQRAKVNWWTLRNEDAIKRVQYPFTASRDEWADEILNLDQLLIEGFKEKWFRQKAKDLGREIDIKWRALKLVVECLIGIGFDEDHASQLIQPFKKVHDLRSKLKGHVSGNEAEEIRKQVLSEFKSFRKHFEHLCAKCDENLEMIIKAFQEL